LAKKEKLRHQSNTKKIALGQTELPGGWGGPAAFNPIHNCWNLAIQIRIALNRKNCIMINGKKCIMINGKENAL